MKFEFFFIGKTTEKYLNAGIENYLNKLGHYVKSDILVVPVSDEKRPEDALNEEAEKILRLLGPKDDLVVLDETGKSFSSIEFSAELQSRMNRSIHRIVFVVGSAYGTAPSLRQRAGLVLSFSRFTFTHQMVRLLLLEQVYRAMTIRKGESYHHG